MPDKPKNTGSPAVGQYAEPRQWLTLAVLTTTGAVVGSLIGALPLAVSLLVAAGALAACLCYFRPYAALCLFFCGIMMTSDAVSLASENAFVIPDMDLGGGLPTAMTSFLLLLFCIAMGRTFLLERGPLPIRLTGLAVYAAIVVLALLTGLIGNNDPTLVRVDLMNMFFPVLCFYLCITVLDSRERILQLLLILLAVTVLKAVVLDCFFLAGKGWEFGLDDRGHGTIVTLDSADLLYCITFILIVVHMLMRRDIRGLRAWLAIGVCIPMLFAVIFSYRRAQWIGFIVSLGLLFLGTTKPARRRMLIAFTMLLCAGLFYMAIFGMGKKADTSQIGTRLSSLFDEEHSSNRHHLLESQRVLLDLSHSPVMGLGLGSRHTGFVEQEFKTIPTNIVHQTFLYIWMKTGLPGLVFFIWLTIRYGKNILHFRKTHMQDPLWGLIVSLAASSGLWLAMFLTSPIPWYMHQTFFKALVAAIIMSLILQADRDTQASSETLP